jgi:uncharacterized protein YuzE
VRTTYDKTADALYIRFAETAVVESEEVRPGVMIDLDSEGRIVGVEILDASRQVATGADLARASAA